MSDGKRHPIQVVVRRTGLTADVLRAWERRYGVVSPKRTPSGYRLYDDQAIATLVRVRELTETGAALADGDGGNASKYCMNVEIAPFHMKPGFDDESGPCRHSLARIERPDHLENGVR